MTHVFGRRVGEMLPSNLITMPASKKIIADTFNTDRGKVILSETAADTMVLKPPPLGQGRCLVLWRVKVTLPQVSSQIH